MLFGCTGVMGLAVLSAGCDDDGNSDRSTAVTAVATTAQLGDFVRNVGGDRVRVDQLLEADLDPHDYEPVPSDAESIVESDIVFRAGFDLDQWLNDLVDNAGGDTPVVDVSTGIEGDQQNDDPHLWLDPSNVLVIVDNVAAGLSQVDPDGAETYSANAAQYKDEVMEMDKEIEDIFASCEPSELKIVTNHDSLSRFADRYGLTVVGSVFPGLETTAEPSAEDLAELIQLIEEEDVRAIFSESSVDTEVEKRIAEESGATVVADLYTDTLGPEGSGAATYLEMMVHNAETIVEGLGCA
jgi:ABC-type Zn uptake system ZnuABC Zn-binding protein ZnuA